MTIRSRRWLTVAALLVAAALTLVLVSTIKDNKDPTALSEQSGPQRIRTTDGVTLSAYSYVPTEGRQHPLIVMPASWGSSATEYAAVANGYAALGYTVVAYAQRGFGASGGLIDLAGPGSQADVSQVIDWALAHLKIYRTQIGVVGTSYGAGVALLAAEKDPRITAVVALSGWTDLTQTLAPGGTISLQPYVSLFAKADPNRMTAPVRAFVAQLRAKDATAALASLHSLAASRSPIDGVAALNRRGTAVMLGDAYEDSLLPPASAITFFDALTGPKRLELSVGDHAGPALSGLLGHKNALWENAARWTDRYLRGGHNGIEDQQPVQLQDATTRQVHGYADWVAAGRALTLRLDAPAAGTGVLSGTSSTSWTRSLTAGVDTVADAGPEQFTNAEPYQAPALSMAAVARSAGAVWAAPAVTTPTLVSGTVQLQLPVAVTRSASLFGYLYDVDASGRGRLMTQGTVTVSDSGPARMSLQPISWTVPAGHHLGLVVDTVDPRYLGQSAVRTSVTLASTAQDAATVQVPVGGL